MTKQPSADSTEWGGEKTIGDCAWSISSPPPRAVLREIPAACELAVFWGPDLGEAIAETWEWLLQSCTLGVLLKDALILALPSGHPPQETTLKTDRLLHALYTGPYTISICVPIVRNPVAAGKALMPPLYPNHQINAVLSQSTNYHHSTMGESILHFRFLRSAKKGEIAKPTIDLIAWKIHKRTHLA